MTELYKPEYGPPDPSSPAELSFHDHELIKQQCELQHATSPEQISGFTQAYEEAKKLAYDNEYLTNAQPHQITELVKKLGKQIEPDMNKTGYRRSAVSFASGGTALSAPQIPEALDRWANAFCYSLINNDFVEPLGSTAQFYKHFEQIHPFGDGNGRVGHLLWAIAETRRTGSWPKTLPPDVFSS